MGFMSVTPSVHRHPTTVGWEGGWGVPWGINVSCVVVRETVFRHLSNSGRHGEWSAVQLNHHVRPAKEGHAQPERLRQSPPHRTHIAMAGIFQPRRFSQVMLASCRDQRPSVSVRWRTAVGNRQPRAVGVTPNAQSCNRRSSWGKSPLAASGVGENHQPGPIP